MITRTSPVKISDAAKRLSDTYNLHRIADQYEAIGKWIAVRLNDGTSDDVLYYTKSDAVRHQHHNEAHYAFVQIIPHTLTYREAEVTIRLHRRMADAGVHLADRDAPSGGRDVIKRASQEDMYNQIRSMFGQGQPSNISYRLDW